MDRLRPPLWEQRRYSQPVRRWWSCRGDEPAATVAGRRRAETVSATATPGAGQRPATRRREPLRRPAPSRQRVHPGAWWLWALSIAVLAVRTTNVLVLSGSLIVVAVVVTTCRTPSPLSRSVGVFARVAVAVVVFRLALQIVVGIRVPGTTLFTVPSVELPAWMAGIQLGGPVTIEALLSALGKGLQLAVVLVAIGSVNALASPARLLRSMPTAAYEVGLVVTIALTAAPQMVLAVGRTHAARKLRGRPVRGMAGLRGMTVPVLEGALDRSLELAASMDTRGFGRRCDRPRWVTPALGLGGLVAVVGLYFVLDPSTGGNVGSIALVVGTVGVALTALIAPRGHHRTRYRPIRWTVAATAITLAGIALVASAFVADAVAPGWASPPLSPLAFPPLPWPIAIGLVMAMIPALVDPAERQQR